MSHLVASEYKCFEDIRRTRPDGSEYWCARELAPVLDYAKWENFAKVIKRAMIACENSGHDTAADFPEVRKIVKAGATTKNIIDYELSRYRMRPPLATPRLTARQSVGFFRFYPLNCTSFH